MKHSLFILLSISLLAFGCNQGKIDKMSSANQQLQAEVQLQDSLLNDFMGAFNEFENNLDLIKEKEGMITLESAGAEMRKPGKEEVINDLEAIDELMERNRQLIAELNERVESAEGEKNQFRRMVNRLNKQMKERDAEIGGLKEELVALNYEVELLNRKADTLNLANAQLKEIRLAQTSRLEQQRGELDNLQGQLNEQEEVMNTAFVLAASAKELKDKNILTKEGGFLGIGATKKLNEDFDASAFESINIQETYRIPVESKRAKLLTQHPEDSYVFNEEGNKLESLEITDPERFWKHSKYLVVVLN
ncbi:MAG: hypothetical protein AAF399_07915 [Bacteroidota bacterium]